MRLRQVRPPRFRGNKMLKKTISFVLAVTTSFLFTGCATYHSVDYKWDDYKAWEYVQENSGVQVYIKYLDRQDIGKVFQRALYKHDIYPVYAVVENKSNDTISFKKDMIASGVAYAWEAAEAVKSSGLARTGIFWLVSLIIWPFILIAIPLGMNANSVNTRVYKDYAQKEFSFGEISPGRIAYGFMYLKRMDIRSNLEFRMVNLTNNAEIKFSFASPEYLKKDLTPEVKKEERIRREPKKNFGP